MTTACLRSRNEQAHRARCKATCISLSASRLVSVALYARVDALGDPIPRRASVLVTTSLSVVKDVFTFRHEVILSTYLNVYRSELLIDAINVPIKIKNVYKCVSKTHIDKRGSVVKTTCNTSPHFKWQHLRH